MSGWNGWTGGEGHDPGPEREPGADRGRPAWSSGPVTPPAWASEETRTAPLTPAAAPADTPAPPPWATAPTQAGVPSAPVPDVPPSHPQAYSPPYPSYGPAPAPRSARGGRMVALVLAMVLVGAGAGFGVWYLGRDRGGTGTPAASAPATGVSASASEASDASDDSAGGDPSAGSGSSPDSGSGSGTSSGTSSDPAAADPGPTAPAGYRLVHDPVGYAVSVPSGWTRREKRGEKAAVVFYDSPSDGRQLQIFELSEATVTESLDLAENDPGYGYAREPGYQALDRATGDTWVELSYRYDDPAKGARRVVDHRFRAADGTLYAIRASGPERLSDALVRAPLTTALASFCPTGAACA
ncbi:hypothetical protein [Streptomyces collinus]|uniref:Uncharacterized protein n=1 Tax=Streptomyces collinus (strain DSM 40733 / Tue 365) TaxID=1214242 RepID=S5V881_STRC3|nr:hypothetical protein [Streptomyces collinus]AGS71339.1 hypothetical protein B446_22635 [Streptomyces collinus Tu 365]UJA09987.1 hypothetical protein HGI10_39490 [Streptomyces collinus]UJA15149.1 hypothetical protein HGI09_24630 [Streptomyces collinus]